jgi:hypothetical protein
MPPVPRFLEPESLKPCIPVRKVLSFSSNLRLSLLLGRQYHCGMTIAEYAVVAAVVAGAIYTVTRLFIGWRRSRVTEEVRKTSDSESHTIV